MGELGSIRRYHYWSSRRIQTIAADNDIVLNRRRWAMRSPSVPFIGQIEIGEDGRNLCRNEVAAKLEIAIGLQAVEDLVTPPPVQFAKGVGHIEFARFVGLYGANDGAVMHVRGKSSNGHLVEVCLFGSMDNFSGYIQKAEFKKDGWYSSAWYAIRELLDSRGERNTSQWDDDESRAVEALKIATSH